MNVNNNTNYIYQPHQCLTNKLTDQTPPALKIASARHSNQHFDTSTFPAKAGKQSDVQRHKHRHLVKPGRNKIKAQTPPKTAIQTQRAQLLEYRDLLARNLEALKTQTAHISSKDVKEETVTVLQVGLLAASMHEQSFGALYNSVLKEEHDMQFGVLASKRPDDHCFAHPSATEYAVAQKNACEKKLAIIDFCLKVLRLNEQAEWIPPSGVEYHLPTALATPVNADKLLNQCLNEMNKIPPFKSANGISEPSGLYHERQYSRSGSCALHANNHYLASWCQRENKTFLPLTTRRFALILEGLINRRNTALNELVVMNLQSGQEMYHAIYNAKNALTQQEEVLGNHYSEQLTLGTEEWLGHIVDHVNTGGIVGKHITDIVNELYGLTVQQRFDTKHNVAHWFKYQSKLLMLEKNKSSLGCGFLEAEKSGHAIAFNKVKGTWYLQDSHLPQPVPCSPSKLIDYIMGYYPAKEEPSNDMLLKEYCRRQNLNRDTEFFFFHYE
nr:hypothetical protein [uncultured Enterobacter sp.]